MGAERDIVAVVDGDALRELHQHGAARHNLADAQQQPQVSGSGYEDAAEHLGVFEGCRKRDHALIVDGRHAELVKRAAIGA